MKFRNLFLALRYQLPIKRLFRNFFITGNAWGMFSINSHVRVDSGFPKIMFTSIESANKAARSMEQKRGGVFSSYKCVFCDGYHIGKNG